MTIDPNQPGSAATPADWNKSTFSYAKDPRFLTKVVKLAFGVYLAVAAIALISDVMELSLLSSDFIDPVEAEANDARQGIVGVLFLLVYAVTGVIFLMWTHRANRNVRGFGAEGLANTPGWAVGWYFVPFANLVKPYHALKEIFQASKDPRAWASVEVPSLFPAWWGLWILSGVLGQLSFRISMNSESAAGFMVSTGITAFSEVMDFPLTLCLLFIVTRISEMQDSLVNRGVPVRD